jgi:hypothetical protein
MPPQENPLSSGEINPFELVKAQVMTELDKAEGGYSSDIANIGVTLDAWINKRLSTQRNNKDAATQTEPEEVATSDGSNMEALRERNEACETSMMEYRKRSRELVAENEVLAAKLALATKSNLAAKASLAQFSSETAIGSLSEAHEGDMARRFLKHRAEETREQHPKRHHGESASVRANSSSLHTKDNGLNAQSTSGQTNQETLRNHLGTTELDASNFTETDLSPLWVPQGVGAPLSGHSQQSSSFGLHSSLATIGYDKLLNGRTGRNTWVGFNPQAQPGGFNWPGSAHRLPPHSKEQAHHSINMQGSFTFGDPDISGLPPAEGPFSSGRITDRGMVNFGDRSDRGQGWQQATSSGSIVNMPLGDYN